MNTMQAEYKTDIVMLAKEIADGRAEASKDMADGRAEASAREVRLMRWMVGIVGGIAALALGVAKLIFG